MSKQNENQFEEFEQVDQALVEGERFVEKHLNKILIAVGAVVLLVLAGYAYVTFYKQPRAEQATASLYVAENNFILGNDSLAIAGEGVASKGLREVAEEYSGTDAASVAHVYTGIALYEEGKYAEAIEELEAFEGDDEYVAPSAVRLIGDCYVQLGKLDEALSAYERAGSMADNPAITPSCLLKAGRVCEKLGKKDKAIALYEEIKDKYYTSPEANTVEADILRAKAGK